MIHTTKTKIMQSTCDFSVSGVGVPNFMHLKIPFSD